ncbi:MAG: SMC-Scp complex subunit ScpB [Steroidobacteraceae bacterium]|nr:SMC-Scp complex subunit ScpB [Steroidobacteraceae bacterium]MDW8260586.1 SMC-Scp complex subunit ScpB [Gammaproteobacteria bacterium]
MKDLQYIAGVVEAALFAAGKPLSLAELAQLFEEPVRPTPAELRGVLAQLADALSARAVELIETASGYRVRVRAEYAAAVARLWPERPQRYSRALLETLALIAYRQPITRAEIEAVRGVAVNPNIIKTLIDRNWVRVVGHRDVPGHPELLGTTREFLDYFGLKSVADLPPLAQLGAVGDCNPQLDLPGTAADAAASASPHDAPRDRDEPIERADLDDEEGTEEPSRQAGAAPASELVASSPDRST